MEEEQKKEDPTPKPVNEIEFTIQANAKKGFERLCVPAHLRRDLGLDDEIELFIIKIRRKYKKGSEIQYTD